MATALLTIRTSMVVIVVLIFIASTPAVPMCLFIIVILMFVASTAAIVGVIVIGYVRGICTRNGGSAVWEGSGGRGGGGGGGGGWGRLEIHGTY